MNIAGFIPDPKHPRLLLCTECGELATEPVQFEERNDVIVAAFCSTRCGCHVNNVSKRTYAHPAEGEHPGCYDGENRDEGDQQAG